MTLNDSQGMQGHSGYYHTVLYVIIGYWWPWMTLVFFWPWLAPAKALFSTPNDPAPPKIRRQKILNDPEWPVPIIQYWASNASIAVCHSCWIEFYHVLYWWQLERGGRTELRFLLLSKPWEKNPRWGSDFWEQNSKCFSYTKKSTASNGGHAFYQCRSYRGPHYCKASIKYTSEGIIVEWEKVHTCQQNGQLKSIQVGVINDVTAEMKQMVIDSCIYNATKSATEVAKHVFESTLQNYEVIFLQITLQHTWDLNLKLFPLSRLGNKHP